MHSSTADNVIYWKLYVWLPKAFVWCVMESFGNVGKTLPELFIDIVYIYIYNSSDNLKGTIILPETNTLWYLII